MPGLSAFDYPGLSLFADGLKAGRLENINNLWVDDIAPNIITNGLVLYAPLWLRNQDIFRSADLYGHTCAVTGATWGLQGRTFDGTDDVIDCGDNDVFSFTDGAETDKPFSMIVWAKTTDYAATRGLVTKRNSATVLEWVFLVENTAGKLVARLYNNGSTSHYIDQVSSSGISMSSFLCLGITYDGSKANTGVILYQNGAVLTSVGSAVGTYTGMSNTETPVRIGNAQPELVNDYLGTIGEVSIYNRALTATEIMNNYLSTKWRYT